MNQRPYAQTLMQHFLARLHVVRPLYILILLVVFATMSVVALRANNTRMVELRDAVYAADKANGDVEGALRTLRSHIYSHMNTDLSAGSSVYPPIQLKYTYQRLQQAEKDRVKTSNAQVYTDAQAYCEQQNPTGFSGASRVPCIEAYVTTHNTQERSIPSALYMFDFVSPAWSFDAAGLCLLFTVILGMIFSLQLLATVLVKILVH